MRELFELQKECGCVNRVSVSCYASITSHANQNITSHGRGQFGKFANQMTIPVSQDQRPQKHIVCELRQTCRV